MKRYFTPEYTCALRCTPLLNVKAGCYMRPLCLSLALGLGLELVKPKGNNWPIKPLAYLPTLHDAYKTAVIEKEIWNTTHPPRLDNGADTVRLSLRVTSKSQSQPLADLSCLDAYCRRRNEVRLGGMQISYSPIQPNFLLSTHTRWQLDAYPLLTKCCTLIVCLPLLKENQGYCGGRWAKGELVCMILKTKH